MRCRLSSGTLGRVMVEKQMPRGRGMRGETHAGAPPSDSRRTCWGQPQVRRCKTAAGAEAIEVLAVLMGSEAAAAGVGRGWRMMHETRRQRPGSGGCAVGYGGADNLWSRNVFCVGRQGAGCLGFWFLDPDQISARSGRALCWWHKVLCRRAESGL